MLILFTLNLPEGVTLPPPGPSVCRDTPICDVGDDDNDGDTTREAACLRIITPPPPGGDNDPPGDIGGTVIIDPPPPPPGLGDIGGIIQPPPNSPPPPEDSSYNFLLSNDSQVANSATVSSRKTPDIDRNNILSTRISNVVRDVIKSSKGGRGMEYNGSTISNFIYSTTLLPRNLSESFRSSLENLRRFNNISVDLTSILEEAVKKAMYRNKLSGYTPDLIKRIANSTKLTDPIEDLRKSEFVSSNTSTAFSRIKNAQKSLYAKSYTSGDHQRFTQTRHILPTDYDLRVPIVTRSGKRTGAKVSNDDTIKVETALGTLSVKEQNDYVKVVSRTGEESIALASRRKKAYGFSLPDLSLIHGYIKSGDNSVDRGNPYYSFDIEASGLSTSELGNVPLKGSYLVKLNLSSITDLPSESKNLRKTSATYSLVWSEGDSVSVFDNAVSMFSGPRNTVFIDADDPWWGTFLGAGNDLTVTYTDLDIDNFDGNLYPRRINTDMLLVPSNKIENTVLQGRSSLISYNPPSATRSLKVTIAPTSKVLNNNYTKPIAKEDGKNVGGKTDLFAIRFSKSFDDNGLREQVLDNPDESLVSSKSPLGNVLQTISSIESNYDLGKEGSVSGIPNMDVFSFLSAAEVIDFIQSVPLDIRNKLFDGVYNNLMLFPINKTDREKTYISDPRLTGTSLKSLQLFTKLPKVSHKYFPEVFKGVLF